jgi:hypothetical protein
MELIEKTISNLVQSQFPEFYNEDGPIFMLFVQKYYEWLEQPGNVLYNSRRIYEYRDIDETTDDFLVFFKETYLKNIQLGTSQNIRQLIKHSLDLYRSKGTERGLTLLFQAAFGVTPKVYYPGDDIFKLSDGHWVIPTYLEVAISPNNVNFLNKQIQGTLSGATAFVDSVVRQSGRKISDILYISSLEGNFMTGEQITLALNYSDTDQRTTIIGSLNDINIDQNGIGQGFAVGDVIDNIQSDNGFGAKVRVSKIGTSTGLVNFQLVDGGYGYSNNLILIVSENVLTLENVSTPPVIFETISQNLATFPYVNANGSFQKDNTLTAYYGNGSVKATARVLEIDAVNSSSGNLFIQVLSGNINTNTIYSDSNAVVANLNLITGFVSQVATGNITAVEIISPNTYKVGVINQSNQFFVNVAFTTSNTNANGLMTIISTGSGANLSISNNMLYTEQVSINTDLLAPYANVLLNATSYGFPGNATANLSTPFNQYLSYSNVTFGKISAITSVSTGSNYNDKPYITLYDPLSSALNQRDYVINYANATAAFAVGELVTQNTTNARALVTAVDKIGNILHLQNLRVSPDNDFITTVDANSLIVGLSSGATANATVVSPDTSTNPEGNNAIITVKLNTANGSIVGLQVIDSGFGYQQGEDLTIYLGNNVVGTATAVLEKQGSGTGYYLKKGGFLSDSKKLFDGYYYQNFSYDIISSLPLSKYSELLKKVVHQAGKIFFGTYCHRRLINMNSSVSSVIQRT